MRATYEHDHKRTDLSLCRSCESTPAGCSARKWLRGGYCCSTCAGNHDDQGQR